MDVKYMIDTYVNWLHQEISFKQLGEYYEITSPFLDMNNDYLQLYAKANDDKIWFSDDGYLLNELISTGFTLSKKKKEDIQNAISQFGVQLDDKELIMEAPASQFPQKKHLFIQAMLRVCDLYSTCQPRQTSLFTEDISGFLDSNEIYCTQNVQFSGKTGFTHNYDFLLQRTKNKPTRLCRAINSPSKEKMSSVLFSWEDTRDARKEESQLIVFLNDRNHIAAGVENGFHNYQVETILWSERNSKQSINLLSA